MTDCQALGPFGETCTREVHAGDRHVSIEDHTDDFLADAGLPEPKGDVRSMQLASWSTWRGDYRSGV